ncbi:hypothetical protein NHX12_018362 [Muraenolepis orangiensis]|uniref:Uncharacterized protein n=1 Tax=Muraenolepis orangiensis TaxID=630683 RepID=A0A9Q0F0P8_9TELE|nr:hypothetical protein NHX12_018362 [Muraenolepis orangiensis]
MASCLVPDFPAVMMALEHLGELDKQLKEEKVPFSPEASHHIKEISAAVTKLEASRRSVHEQLEVETIENGKMRHQIHKIRDKISQDIMADVDEARKLNAKEIEELRGDLDSISELHKTIVNRQEELITQNALLYPEREQVKTEHQGDTAAFNHQMSIKLSRQVQLQQTLTKVEELKTCIAAVERDKAALECNMAPERETFGVTKNRLLGEVEQAAKRTLQQMQENARKKKKLDKIVIQLLDKDDRLAELTHRRAQLELAVERLTVSRGQHEQQLRDATRSQRDAVRQTERSERELRELRQRYQTTARRLQQDLVLVDRDLDEGKAAGGVHRESLVDAAESFKARRREEDEARALHLGVSLRLERSTLRLEERLVSITKHRAEAREMEEEIGRLLETNVLNGALFREGQEKLHRRLEVELKNVEGVEEEMGQLARLLQEAKREQEAYVAKATAKISSAQRRYGELCQEEVTLGRSLSSNEEEDSLTGQVTRAGLEFVQMESGYCEVMERLARDTQHFQRESEAKKRELEQAEATLREAEARYSQEESTLQRLERLIARLEEEKSQLELSTEDLCQNTGILLRPRGEMKAELEATQAHHRALLVSQASALRVVEVGIRNSGQNLEQVSMENGRMRLSILRMRDDIVGARKDEERHRKRIVALGEEESALFEHVMQAWREDLVATREGRAASQPLLEALGGVSGQLEKRSVRLESVAARVHQQLLHISEIGH